MEKIKDTSPPQSVNEKSIVIYRIIALWSLSESALGGVLHLLKLPFTGLLIGGVSVLLISLLAAVSNKRGTILKALLIVISVKAFVAPYAPLNSYLALILQGLIGEVLFFSKRFYPVSAIMLALITALLGAFQKIIVLTLLFGMNLWLAVDSFMNSVINQFVSAKSADIKFSYIIVGIYVFLHVLGGIFFGLIALRIPRWIKEKRELIALNPGEDPIIEVSTKVKKKKLWYRRRSGIIFLSVSVIIIIFSYLLPGLGKGLGSQMIIMILRSVIITIVWFYLIAPIVIKLFKKFIEKSKMKYSEDVNRVILILPNLKASVKSSYDSSASLKGTKRIKEFISSLIACIVLSE
ncbi:MAG: hypothetical protein C0412_04000 [Flavobacterium sp.]|nr:hypothetical protein [Flavobacterium sp.]